MMVLKWQKTSHVFIAIVSAVLVIIAIAVVYSLSASQQPKQNSLVSPDEMHARDVFRANWQAIQLQERVQKAAAQVPVTGNSATQGQPQISIDAEVARLNGLAAEELGQSRRSIDAEVARLDGLAAQEMGQPQRSIDAEVARLNGLAAKELGR